MVTIGQLVLFSTQTGDAWLFDLTDRLAARLAQDGESEPLHIEETRYHVCDRPEGPLFHRRTGFYLFRP